jgi:hypothetical protein
LSANFKPWVQIPGPPKNKAKQFNVLKHR